jgi:protein involved in polysaccharide export with SLBB domain
MMHEVRTALISALLLSTVVARAAATDGVSSALQRVDRTSSPPKVANEQDEPEEPRPALVDAPSGPVDPAVYEVGPGDRFLLTVPGVLSDPLRLLVDAEGGLLLPGAAGRVDVAGTTLVEARQIVYAALEREFRGRRSELILLAPRRFKVYVGGAVERPGSYLASSLTRVSEIIEQAGGVASGGSERRIRIDGGDGRVREADLVGFATLGDRDRNPWLRGGDLVHVPAALEFYAVYGGVARPGRYELRPGETLGDAIALAGGEVPGARLGMVELRRAAQGELGPTEVVDLSDAAVAARPLSYGDALTVPVGFEPRDLTAVVDVVGEVRHPGRYPISPGSDVVVDLLERAGGYTEWANIERVQLLRRTDTPGRSDVRATIETSVIDSQMPIERELIRMNERDWPQPVIGNGQHERLPATTDAVLEDRDILYVPRLSGRVLVDGRVRKPGFVSWEEGLTVEDYIERAGGYDRGADQKGVRIQRAGQVGQLESAWRAAPVVDGDQIWVPEKPPFDGWRLAREVSAFLAQVAAIIIIVDQVTN